MPRKLVRGVSLLLALAALGALAWRLWPRGGDDPAPVPSARPGAVAPAPAQPAAPASRDRDAAVPRGSAPRWSLDADREGTLRLEGQVVNADGSGVGDAEVWLSSVPPRQAKTEADGTFVFDKLVGRRYQLSARRGPLIGGPVSHKLTEGGDPVVIRVAEGAAVVVAVIDEARQPIRGAEVKGSELSERAGARTNDQGEATLRPVHPGYVGVTATASGYAPGSAFTTVGSAGAVGRVTVTLRKGVAVSGRVVDESGAPIAKARVALAEAGWGDGDDDADPGALTDAKGAFTIAAVAAGTHKLEAVDGAHAPATSDPVTVADRPVAGVTIVMRAGGLVAGRVIDSAGKPAPYATVRVAGAGPQMWAVAARQATADAEGAFELRGLARSKLRLRAESEQAASRLVDVELGAAPEKRGIELVLDVVGTIAGKVVDDQGAPVAEIQVNALPDFTEGGSLEGLALAGMSSAATNGAGEFTLRGLPDGAYQLWVARAVRSPAFGRRGTPAKTGDRAVRITLPAPGGLKGKLALEGGGAPRAALVQVGTDAPTPAQGGAFEVRDVPPGSYDVTFRGADFAELVRRDVAIEAGEVTDLGTIAVVRGRRLAGVVVDAKGNPVAGAKVKVGDVLFSVEGREDQLGGVEELSGVRTTTSGPDGTFAIIGVPSKATNAAAEHPTHGRSAPVAIAAGAQDPPALTLALRGFGSISGRVVQQGAPQAGVTITLSGKGGGAQLSFGRTDERGAFTLSKVPEGSHVVQAMMQGGVGSLRTASATAVVKAGQETQVTIDVPVGQLTLTVQPRALPSQKIDAAQVFVFAGQVAPTTGKQVFEAVMQGGVRGSDIWWGDGKPPATFKELVPGEYSICTLPLNGDLRDPKFGARLQAQAEHLKVYCKVTTLPAAPLAQAITHEVPAMAPLPSP